MGFCRQNVTDWTGGQQPGFSSLSYVSKQFYRKKSGPRTPRPPGGPPFLGMSAWSAEWLPSTRNWSFRWPLAATHQPAPSDTQGNASRQLAVVVVFGGRVAPALWRLTFAAPTSWMSLSVGGSGLAGSAALPATCRSCDSAAVVPERPGRGRPRLFYYCSPK